MPRRKLIEVDLPLDTINAQSSREKSIRHGHPSTLHLWWARRPLAACRAVIFASMVDDPIDLEEYETDEEKGVERARLHRIIERLVRWESTDETKPEARALIDESRWEIARSVARGRGETPPARDDPAAVLRYLRDNSLPIYDPFAGGGSIPLEAQRLGLNAIASDLNPVAVLINKALIEIPPKFAGRPPSNPDADPMGLRTKKLVGRGKNRKPEVIKWRGAMGLADDIRYYGRWMRERAFERIGHLYPKAKLPDGGEATVIAWLWARTVPCSNPACGISMPLLKTFRLSTNKNNSHWIRPLSDEATKTISFEAQNHDEGVPPAGRTVTRNGAVCIVCDTASPLSYVREQSRAGRMGEQMTAVVAEGDRKRIFLSPTDEHIAKAREAKPSWRPAQRMPTTAYKVSGRGYGIENWHELFTERQLVALTTFSDLLSEVRALVVEHRASTEYADAVCTYLALAVGRLAGGCSSFSRWENTSDGVASVFSRQAIPMIWDFAEANPFSHSTQNWKAQVDWVARVIERLSANVITGEVHQADASTTIHAESGPVIVTDPPYYDNISYAELSDFFYVWLRPLLREIYPELFSGILVPVDEEMIAVPRFENARERFEDLMGKTLKLIRERSSPEFPSSIFYAYKQQEESRDGKTSTGWETMLTALVDAGFRIVGTWPMRTELANRSNALVANSLASSVVLVCRPRAEDAPTATRSEFIDELEASMPAALRRITREGHITPVDLRQAAIGPGMEVYSRFSRVETISGDPVPVRDALTQINRVVDEYHRQEQGSLDAESNFCVDWLRGNGYGEGAYGEAEVLAQAVNISVESLRDGHRLLTAVGGKVQLLPLDSYSSERSNELSNMTVWEGCMRMAYHLSKEDGGGTAGAAAIARRMGSDADSAERLARILYDHFDKTGDSSNAVVFNMLVSEWENIQRRMGTLRIERQASLGE